jgi:hypothetical protein
MREGVLATASKFDDLVNEGDIARSNVQIEKNVGVELGNGIRLDVDIASSIQRLPEGYYVVYTGLSHGGQKAKHVMLGAVVEGAEGSRKTFIFFDTQNGGEPSLIGQTIKVFPVKF